MLTATTFYVVPHTHWDREWHQPFQVFRARLVKVMDSLLELMEKDPAFCFTLDGQAIILEDYLQLRPQNEQRLRALIGTGRLAVGPWYVLPDEFLVSGEALIRNLERGHQVCSRFGFPMAVGYLPDQFGHSAAMPQILTGFGLDTAVLWRGVPPQIDRVLFWWEGPDGQRVLVVYLATSYSNGKPLLMGDPDGGEPDRPLETTLRQIATDLEPFRTYLENLPVLVMYGRDHAPARPRPIHPWVEIGTMEGFARLVRERMQFNHDRLPMHRGELYSPARAPILSGVLSSRMWIKQADREISTLLENYAEPLATMLHMASQEPSSRPGPELELAWKYLLQNQPHDSVCGCSVDPVHQDMAYRYRQARLLAVTVIDTARSQLRELVQAHASTESPGGVWVINTSGVRQAVMPVAVPQGAGRDPLWFYPPPMPPVGWQICHHSACHPLMRHPSAHHPTGEDAVWAGPDFLENRWLRVESTGAIAFRLIDKETGIVYPACNLLVDEGDRGDGYNFDPLPPAVILGSPEVPVPEGCWHRKLIARGPVLATLRMTGAWRVPAGLSRNRQHRSRRQVSLAVTCDVSLGGRGRVVDIRTVIQNRACDHRLAAYFGIPFPADEVTSAGHFHPVVRPVSAAPVPALPEEGTEKRLGSFPHRGWVDISAAGHGLTVMTAGLPEYTATVPSRLQSEVDLSITLLRCVGWLSRADLATRRGHAGPGLPTPEAQMEGTWEFRYALYPHPGDWRQADSPGVARSWSVPPLVEPTTAEMPGDYAFVAWEPAHLCLSALYVRDHRVLLRLYDPTGISGQATVHFAFPPSEVIRVNLKGEATGEPLRRIDERTVCLTYTAGCLITLAAKA